jgi:type IV secretory pathway TraG/TraD family ATPase VirD4
VTLTETTDIDLEALKHQLFTFYLAVPSRSRDSKLIGSLMVNFLLDHILEIRESMKYPVAMLLDEFTNFGKISGIEDTLSIIRKNKIGLVLGFQNYFQLEKVYSRKEAQIILDQPATQVYFKQKNYREAKDLSDALGRTTIEEPIVTDSGRVQDFIQGRALATPEELINLKDQVIVFTPDTWPLKLPLTSPTAYNQALEYPPPERDKHTVSEYVKTRGRTDRDKAEAKKNPPNDRRGGSRGDRQREKPKSEKMDKKKDQEVKRKSVVDDPPDLGDVWEL